VRFRVSDVFLPDAVFVYPPSEEDMEGTILDFSDSGQNARAFAVIDVTKRQTVVVPVEKLQAIPRSAGENEH
jgi:hypothetical protein